MICIHFCNSVPDGRTGYYTGNHEHRPGDLRGAKRHSCHYCDFSHWTVCFSLKNKTYFDEQDHRVPIPVKKPGDFSIRKGLQRLWYLPVVALAGTDTGPPDVNVHKNVTFPRLIVT
jgi:hypothetical protein